MNNTLESHKFFPYIAWVVVIGFALFTYSLTVRLQQELSAISGGIQQLNEKIDNLDAANKTKAADATKKVAQ